MQVKKINNLIISFVPAYLLAEVSDEMESCRDFFDFIMQTKAYYELENSGEQFLQCANINPMVKILAGYLSTLSKESVSYKNSIKLMYSPKFTPRDMLACLENFIGFNNGLHFKQINYKTEGGEKKIAANAVERARPEYMDAFERDSLTGHNYLINNYKKVLCRPDEVQPNSAGMCNHKYIILIGSTAPLFSDLFEYLNALNVKVIYFEYIDALIKSENKNLFSPELILNITVRLDNIKKIIDSYKKNCPQINIGVMHIFPKFSHYEIEDHFFSKNIGEKYLPLEYAGGEKLSERDKIRLEAFIKIIN